MDTTKPLVNVLMAVMNGEKFIGQQLESIAAQRFVDVRLWVSDDASTDDTKSIVTSFAADHPEIETSISIGPGNGFAANFLSMVCSDVIEGRFFAFADQDDIWHPDKLAQAVIHLSRISGPGAYFSRSRIIDETGQWYASSPLYRRAPSLRNALVQSIGGGNTAVFNEEARHILRSAGPNIDVPAHDWWLYQAVAACGGEVIYDPFPYIDYRQHRHNAIGANGRVQSQFNHIKRLMAGRIKEWNKSNIAALRRIEDLIPFGNRKAITEFERLVNSRSVSERLQLQSELKLYRQTILGNMALNIEILAGRL